MKCKKKFKRTLTTPYRPLPQGERGGIQLLLIHSVEHVGKQGQVVEVKPGYAYNYLIPQGLATVASEHHKRMVEKHKAKLQEIERARLASLRTLADNIGKQSITIEANANDEGQQAPCRHIVCRCTRNGHDPERRSIEALIRQNPGQDRERRDRHRRLQQRARIDP